MSTRFYLAVGPGGNRGKIPGGKKSVKSWEEKDLGGKRVSSLGRKNIKGEKEC